MKINELKNKFVKKIVEVALKEGFKVTKSNYIVSSDYGTPIRIQENGKNGWDILSDLVKKSGMASSTIGATSKGLNFQVFENSIILYDER